MFSGVSPRRLFSAIVVLLVMSSVAISGVWSTTSSAAPGINQTINFQGRLFTASGATVPDGYYNVQFKIYQDGTGTAVGNPGGTLLWTEDHINSASQGVLVRNGFMSVELGSVTAFGSSIDWNQDTLWLSMNIGNTNVSCTPFSSCGGDGEMVPMKRLSAVPYAMNALQLGGRTAGDFIQNQNASVQTAANFWIGGTARADTGILTPVIDTATGTNLSIGSANATSVTIGNTSGSASLVLSATQITLGVATSPTTLQAASQTTANTQGSTLTIQGASGNGTGNGGNVTIQGGSAGGSGQYGGNLTLAGGTGSVSDGLVILGTAAYQTISNDASCFPGGSESTTTTNCTIEQSSVNNNGSVIVGFTNDGQTAFMPNPSITTAGRIVYITASNLTKDFILSINGGGQGNLVAMRKNSSATMVWNGSAWTVSGASSSTTLQAAYDNTLQSAGGAELVVSKTSATNGLTIRDSSIDPVNGTLLSVQSSSAAGLLSVNSNVTEYVSNGGAETAGTSSTTFPANTWSALSGASVTRYTTPGNFIATGQGSVSVATSTSINSGVANRLKTQLSPNMMYNVSFTTRLASGTFTDMEVYYSADGTSANAQCATAKAAITSIWTKINCSFTAPSGGITANNSLMIRQASAGTARTFFIDNLSITIAADFNYATDGSVLDGDNFATNWLYAGLGTGSVTRSTTDGEDASDSARVSISAGAANAGIRNKLSLNPLPSTLYRITAYAKVASGTFNDFKIRYSRDGSTTAGGNYIDCVDYNTRSISTSQWTKVTCFIQTDATVATNPHVYFVGEASAARTFNVDAFTMTLTTNTAPNVQIGGGENGGPTTLLTLDKAASAPIAINNDALLGSMYYDTTLGKLQCYEADGWGACGSSPNTVVTIAPEFTNAVLHGTGIGTMVSDLCSDTLNINDGTSGQPDVCGTNETYNFYRWSSPQPSAQIYSVYVTYQLPATFKTFESGATSIMGLTDSVNSIVEYQVYKNDQSTGLTTCGPLVPVSSGAAASWQTGLATGTADPSTCGFAPGNSIVFRINVTASQNSNAYIGNLNFIFSNR